MDKTYETLVADCGNSYSEYREIEKRYGQATVALAISEHNSGNLRAPKIPGSLFPMLDRNIWQLRREVSVLSRKVYYAKKQVARDMAQIVLYGEMRIPSNLASLIVWYI